MTDLGPMLTANDVPAAVLFDLDGTLIDSFPGIADSYHYMLQEMNMRDMTDRSIRELVGQNISTVLAEHFGLSGGSLEEGVSTFRHDYGLRGLYRYSKYDGVEQLLEQLRDEAVTLCIATSKLQNMTRDLLDHAGWSETFTVVGGAEPDGSRTHKRDIIAWSLGQLPKGTQAVAMVGDRGTDIASSQELGLPGIGVTWGYGDRRELIAAGASVIVDSPDELLRALHRI